MVTIERKVELLEEIKNDLIKLKETGNRIF